MKNTRNIIALATIVLLGAGCAETAPSNGIQTTTPSVPAAAASKRLDLSDSTLEKVPSSVFSKTDLEELDLSGNRLTGALPAEIRLLERLRVLDASDNAMTGVPAEIGQLASLQTLDLSQNALTGLPLELGNLKNLRRLDLRGNAISQQDLEAIRTKLPSTEILVD
ncbi:MAG: leucine-rich repeat domain-containing protein [Patescibacteria group bacterium]|jgi:Leucine-rich repeat (LRR) protein